MIILIAFAAVTAWLLIVWEKPRADAYNKHVCAVYGYKADCKTPLPESEKLK